MIDIFGFSSKTECHIVYPTLPSTIWPVLHSDVFTPPGFMSFVDDRENEEMEYSNLVDKNCE